MSHVAMPGESSPGRGTSLCKGPETGEACEQGQVGVARGNRNGLLAADTDPGFCIWVSGEPLGVSLRRKAGSE